MSKHQTRVAMHYLAPIGGVLIFLLVVLPAHAEQSPMTVAPDDGDERPNFIFVITDDISAGDLGLYGNEAIRTPHLDQLAEQGVVLENAYLTISSCSPSRNSIITGRYPHNTGAPEIHVPLPEDQHTFIQDFNEAGYHTVLSGKNHMAPPDQLGFDMANDSQPAGSENWIDHLQNRPEGKPFFFWFASHDAHRPWQFNDNAPRYKPDEVWVPPYLYDGPRTRKDLASYYHEVSRTDYYVGKIVEELERQGIAENTYIIYASDNGRPFPRSKTYLYESGIRTPLIIAGPRVSPGRTDALVSAIDFAPTFLDLAGLDKPKTIQGVSFRSVLLDHEAEVRDVAFAERNWHRYRLHERMVRYGDWLYIRNYFPNKHNLSGESDPSQFPAAQELWDMHEQRKLSPAQHLITQVPQPIEQLYNVETDPHQTINLVHDPQHQDVLKRMQSLLDQWIEETGDTVPDEPTLNRNTLRGERYEDWRRGELPGEAKNADTINAPGPLRVRESSL
jgi:arylsulfatase